jgi:hypothetical protein
MNHDKELEAYKQGETLLISDLRAGDVIFDCNAACMGKVDKIARVNIAVTTYYAGKPLKMVVRKPDIFYVIRDMTTEGDWLSGILHRINRTN